MVKCSLCGEEGKNQTSCKQCPHCGGRFHGPHRCNANRPSAAADRRTPSAIEYEYEPRTVSCSLCGQSGRNKSSCVECPECGERFHGTHLCRRPQAQYREPSPVHCSLCGHVGRNKSTCAKCPDCGERFHDSHYCRRPPEPAGVIRCSLCGQAGRNRSTCEHCRLCGQRYHTSKQDVPHECKQAGKLAPSPPQARCSLCGQAGRNQATCEKCVVCGERFHATKNDPLHECKTLANFSPVASKCSLCHTPGRNSRTCQQCPACQKRFHDSHDCNSRGRPDPQPNAQNSPSADHSCNLSVPAPPMPSPGKHVLVKQEPLLDRNPAARAPPQPKASGDEFKLIPWSDLKLMQQLGAGSFGEVYKAQWVSAKLQVAVKVLRLPGISVESSDYKEFRKEIEMLAHTRSDRVVAMYGASVEPPNLALVMELMPNGSLHDYLQAKPALTWKARFALALHCAQAVQHLHALQPPILHRDIKSLNFLVDSNGQVKIADFGLARTRVASHSRRRSAQQSFGLIGTTGWMAPETLSLKPRHSTASDVYALGTVLWEIITGEFPYREASSAVVMDAVRKGEREEIPANTPIEYAELIQDCWADAPNRRPGAREVARRIELLCEPR